MSAVTNPATIASLTAGLFRARRPRTGQRVHRNSFHEGEKEVRPWHQHNTFADSEHNARMRAAEEFDDRTKQPGKRNGALGYVALKVYRAMLRLRSRKTGRLDPTYGQLADRLTLSRSAVFRAVQRLKQHGFLDWVRRTRPVDDPEPDGQYNEQISNAYILELRGAAAALVGMILRRPTEKMRQIADAKRRKAESDALSDEEFVASVADPELRSIIARGLRVGSANPPTPITDTL